MTKAQREILKGYLDNESSFPIHTIEYPAHVDGHGDANLKIVSSVKGVFPGGEKWTRYVDFFATDGRTVETRRFSEDR